MLVTLEQKRLIEERFEMVKTKAAGRADALFAVLDTCNEEELICMKYLYAFMPEQDLANYEGELFLKFVRQALKIRNEVPWGEKIDGSLFLNYVLQYRINNENIEFYTETFYDQLIERVKDKSMYEAAVEVNYWCFENATYQSTDIRTASPFTVIRNGYGRCGEESTFNVAALRSIGIPARQIYAPRWAHCDDNHAWTEVWTDGEWHFLGACEPEQVLDTGWYMLPASKGMLIHNKVLSTIVEGEEIVYTRDGATEINVLPRYADTKHITVVVKNTAGEVVEGAHVRFELINYSELYPLTDLVTDAKGEASFLTGLGDLMICAYNDKAHAYAQFDVRLEDRLEITLPDTFIKEEGVAHLVLKPSEGLAPTETQLTDAQRAAHDEKHAKALALRAAFRETFYIGEKAESFAKAYAPYEVEVQEALEKSLGNYQELIAFFEDAATSDLLAYKVKLLGTLRKKDFTDVTCEILVAHLVDAIAYKDAYAEDVFVANVLAPRVFFETLSAYRAPLRARLSEETLASFKEDPRSIHHYVMTTIANGYETNYSTFYAEPVGLMDLKVGNLTSKKILSVALYRALGIPARFNNVDQTVSFYQDGAWITCDGNDKEVLKTSTLTLHKEDEALELAYMRNFTIGQLVGTVYQTLDFEDVAWEDATMTYEVEAGRYRIITTNRQADGTLLTRFYYVDVAEGKAVDVTIGITQEEGAKVNIAVKDQALTDLEGNACMLSDVVADSQNIVAYLGVGGEPTEHLFNEMLESAERFNSAKPNVIFILQAREDYNNLTLQKVLNTVPNIGVYVGHDEVAADTIYSGFDIQDKKLPLAYVMNESMKAQYAWAGYNVGIGELLLKYLA